MGAHVRTIDGVNRHGVRGVGAERAARQRRRRLQRLGRPRATAMWLRRECGVWELFVPGVGAGARYKYELEDNAGHLLPLRVDPFAFFAETRPRNASIVWDAPPFAWTDADWMAGRGARQHRDAPISIYEVHLGSWRARAPRRATGF